MSVRIINEDMREALRDLAAAGVQFHSCVTDPPYHLTSGKKGGTGAASLNLKSPAGRARISTGFMGQAWDGGDIAFQPETWRSVYDVLLPGAHLLAFSGTRTYHRMACAIEDAGFEIRDQIGWMFGSGFPKSQDVSKFIDKRRDWTALIKLQSAIKAARETLGISQSEAARRMGLIEPNERLGGGGFMWFETGMRVPTRDQWSPLKSALDLSDEFDAAFEAAEREVIGQHSEASAPGGFGNHRFSFNSRDITAPATPEAAAWQGWGTALKPAWEPIVVARKPLIGSVAGNVLAHGCGALNIDACRVGINATDDIHAKNPHTQNQGRDGGWCTSGSDGSGYTVPLGRWPANVIHDGSPEVEEAFAAFGERTSGNLSPGHKRGSGVTSYDGGGGIVQRAYGGDSGSASRFYYSAKADKTDRSGSKHPTVKPTDLMRYLVQLVTPPGGTVLDPFAGSGSTGLAADQLGMNAVLIERDPEYAADIERKITSDAPLFAEVVA